MGTLTQNELAITIQRDFTKTWPASVQSLADVIVRDAIEVHIGSAGAISQDIVFCDERAGSLLGGPLEHVLYKIPGSKALEPGAVQAQAHIP